MKRFIPTATLTLALSAAISASAAMASSITVDSNARMRAVTDHTTQSKISATSLQKVNESRAEMKTQSMNSLSGSRLAHTAAQLNQKKNVPGYCSPFVSSHEAADDPLYLAALYKCEYGS